MPTLRKIDFDRAEESNTGVDLQLCGRINPWQSRGLSVGKGGVYEYSQSS
jgi:hypothetical protein